MNKQPTAEALKTLEILTGPAQRRVMLEALRGAEGEHFRTLIEKVHADWQACPATYAAQGLGVYALARFHFFTAGCDWWIVEKDSDPDGEGQIQAFGVADLGMGCRELGYISIPEILKCGAELDLYYTSVTVAEILKGGLNP